MNNFSPSDIQNIDPSIITCCSYHRDYFKRLQKDAPYFFRVYDHILQHAEHRLGNKLKEDAHLFDFGCGQGLLGIYAKMMGWGKISLMDMNEHCIQNAKGLCKYLNITNVDFTVGTEADINSLFNDRNKPDVLVSTDVIEHVYDISKLLSIFKKELPDTALIFTTGAVAENPLRSNMMRKLQVEDENNGSDPLQTKTDNPYAGLSFREVRKRIIQKSDTADKLTPAELAELAVKTRGLNEADIIISVNDYFDTGKMPEDLKHPTNTCDPISSSWTERLLTVKEYQAIFKKDNYKLEIFAGVYNDISNSGLKKLVLTLLNQIVRLIQQPQYGAYLLLEATPI